MAKFVPSVADQPIKMNEIAMLKSPKTQPRKVAPKLVAVIKNSLTDEEMDKAGEQWVNHQGPYMTVAETLAYAAERDKKRAADAP